MNDAFRILVDGETFEVAQDRHSGTITTQFRWVSGPDPAYGFSVSRSDGSAVGEEEAQRLARSFLNNVDRSTGYLHE